MVASGTWTDPKTGASYAFGDKLPSADFNSWIGGIRVIDQNVVTSALVTFPHRLAPVVGGLYLDAIIDTPTGTLVMSGSDGSSNASGDYSPDMHAVTGGTVASASSLSGRSLATDGAGTIVMGVGGIGTSTGRVRLSTDAGANWSVQSLSTATSGVDSVVWNGSLFVIGYGTAGTSRIASSPTGTTWTDGTNPLSNTQWLGANRGGIVTDGAGKVVLIPSDAAQSAFAYSADGLTWSSASTTSATWLGAAYTPEFGWIAYDTTGAAIWTSTSGSAWAVGSGKTLPTGATVVGSVGAIANVLVMLYGDGTDSFLAHSTDGGDTWASPSLRFVAQSIVAMKTSGGRIIVLDTVGTEYVFVSAKAPI